ncbi:fused MFS/spermidine synthase [Gordonia sp. PDNC005]|uniref:spermidine synthase n=1 Tax=unclassified Gordonia (in: high G+C Gram-positive bacteria) TaxID=2657482 RepID=UPI001964FBFB|nr:fused MFS/spermidine synthase [Gordonia sp. PDNC005]QRY60942.1 fused MFS/spermidine synthase [Gordonia sp. PDNC005]
MAASHPAPTAGVFDISTGTAELVHSIDGGWLLSINGAQSSHIDPDRPEQLDFEYMRQAAAAIADRYREASTPLRVLHLGAAACALPRFLAHRYPQSRHVAVEIDADLARLAREWFDLPRAPRLRIRVGDARDVTESLLPETRDVVMRDAFSGSVTPEHLTTAEFTRAVQRVLVPGGLYIANCGDRRDLNSVRSEVSTIAEVFENVALISDPAMFKGRRSGNIVVVASDGAVPDSADLERTLRSDPEPARLMSGTAARSFGSGRVRRDV